MSELINMYWETK